MGRFLPRFALVSIALLGLGCAEQAGYDPWQGGALSSDAAAGSHRVVTEHYIIHTTIADPAVPLSIAGVMESAWHQYARMAPTVTPSARPLEIWVFADRSQWARFTEAHTGPDAPRYLQINRGGYTLGDICALYYLGPDATCAVAAHEGFHQFVARHFAQRPPPFLEEGLATTFESIVFDASNQPHWITANAKRAHALRLAINQRSLWPTARLVQMHAGDVIGQPGIRIEAFYAQDWAFARFMLDADQGKYRPALNRLLADCAAGRAYPANPSPALRFFGAFDPTAVEPMVERYMQMPLGELDPLFQAYMRRLAE